MFYVASLPTARFHCEFLIKAVPPCTATPTFDSVSFLSDRFEAPMLPASNETVKSSLAV